jgi:tRNA dimethylallyltransferase
MAVSCGILVILGPTASGKSELAMALARRAGAQILSVDSMQVYRGMDIGTAKASATERAEVRHHLVDVVEPSEVFTVARFVQSADAVIAGAAARKIRLIATGGTPLYYKALFEGLFEGPSADPAVRQKLADSSNEELARRLAEVDPASAQRIHANDTRRMIRALEVFELAGKPISSLQKEWGAQQHRHQAVWVGLDWDRETLNRRINARVKGMLAGGWVEEVKVLLQKHGALAHTAAEATGYRQIIEHLQGKLTLEDAAEQIKIATRQLARRQMKWFRRFPNVKWMPGNRALEENVKDALELWGLS